MPWRRAEPRQARSPSQRRRAGQGRASSNPSTGHDESRVRLACVASRHRKGCADRRRLSQSQGRLRVQGGYGGLGAFIMVRCASACPCLAGRMRTSSSLRVAVGRCPVIGETWRNRAAWRASHSSLWSPRAPFEATERRTGGAEVGLVARQGSHLVGGGATARSRSGRSPAPGPCTAPGN
jgi:hypothetical protein